MNRVEKAIESGRCAIAVGESLLRDPEVMLALTQRATLLPMALGGPAVSPVQPVSADGVARATAAPGGVLVLVEPEGVDAQGLKHLSELLSRSRHRPDVIVVARAYNPFAFGGALTGFKVAHEKGRGKTFLQSLPDSPVVEALPVEGGVKPSRKEDTSNAPRFCFVGRDDELAEVALLLAEGGPIVIDGPPGVGRTQLLEHAIRQTSLTRLPDFALGWGAGADSLAARLAHMGQEIGDSALFEMLKGAHSATQVCAAAAAILANPAMAGKLFVVQHLEYGLGRENDFFRRSRLELLLLSMLTQPAALPVVFLSTRQPTFHREGEGASLRRFTVGGLKGRFLHEIFEAHKSLEFPRDKYGPINERIHGHPVAARTMATATRIRKDGAEIVDDAKFMAAESVTDVRALEKQLAKRVEKLPPPLRIVLARLAHLRIPGDGTMLANELGVNRKDRLELLSLGLLDMVGTEEDRKYRVHPLIRAQLTWREVSDYDVCEKLADMYASLAPKAEGLAKLQLEQEQNRFAATSRNNRLRPRLELPEHDMVLESATGLMRSKNARLDLVEQRIAEVLNQNPHNADAWLLRLELFHHRDRNAEALEPVLEEAIEKAPVPELFQQVVSWLLSRRQRARAISVLERGVAVFPHESRLHTRLAAVLMRQGRRNEAIDHLKKAMEIDPMLPDSYGLLGMARRDEGVESAAEAEQLLREAVRLAPTDPVQIGRLVELLLEQARVEADGGAAKRTEAKALLEDAIRGDRRAPEACLLYATLVREEGGDPERSRWLLDQAKKLTDRGHERSRRILVERALNDMVRGDLDSAERLLREHVGRDPSHARAFAALGHVLEAREQFIPAHAEYGRAKERSVQNSFEGVFYDQQLKRMQAVIEAQAAGLWTPAEKPVLIQPSQPSTRVLRRAGQADGPFVAEPEADAEGEPDGDGPQVAYVDHHEADGLGGDDAGDNLDADTSIADANISGTDPADAAGPEVA